MHVQPLGQRTAPAAESTGAASCAHHHLCISATAGSALMLLRLLELHEHSFDNNLPGCGIYMMVEPGYQR